MKPRQRVRQRATTKRRKASDSLGALRRNKLLRQQLAKFIALHCFRNSMLEDLHAGVSPSSVSGDYSDVKVISPYGEIPWIKLSRLNDVEMKDLMMDVVDRCYAFVEVFVDCAHADALLEALKHRDVASEWAQPKSRRRGGRKSPVLR